MSQLERRFGDAYRDYKARVRRWLQRLSKGSGPNDRSWEPGGRIETGIPQVLPAGVPLEPVTHTINDTCAALGLGRTRVYELMADGSLESIRLGRRRLVTRWSIEALVERSLG